MMRVLGVFPHYMSASSPTVDGRLAYIVTGNGVDEGRAVPAPRAPSFIAVNKLTGAVAWRKVGPGEQVLDGQWSSPAIGMIGGVKQVVFPGGDGRLYAYEPATGKELWTFQCNPEGTVYRSDGRGTRNDLVATPVIHGDRVFIAMGRDPEHGAGPGHLYAVDATRRGDITKTGAAWRNDEADRGLATVSIHDRVLYHCDLSGNFRAIDAETGKVLWRHDIGSAVWGSPYYVDGKVFLGDEDGHVTVFAAGREKKVLGTIDMNGAVPRPWRPTACCTSPRGKGFTLSSKGHRAIRRR